MINLFPPYLSQEGYDFNKVWELFCFQALSLHCNYKIENPLEIREAPDNGIDIFDKKTKIAYQCKSTESGNSNGHNLTKIVSSYNEALKVKDELSWEKYIICVNYELNDELVRNIKEKIQNVEVFDKSFFNQIAKKEFNTLKRNFKFVIPLSNERIHNTISRGFVASYSQELKQALKDNKY